MEITRKTVLLAVTALLLLGMGTAGYMLIEGWPFFDALYMTVITVYTVGYNEMRGLSFHGRIFTIFLIVTGVGFFLFVGANIIQFMLEGRIRRMLGRRKLEKSIEKLRDHYIVCGYGRIGRVLCKHMAAKPVDVVVIDREAGRAAKLEEDGHLFLIGDSTDEDVLARAGIARAKGVISALGADTDNVFVVLTARQRRPDLFIMSRANEASSVPKLMAAGADRVVSPYEIAAHRMAEGILRPTVTDFLDLTLGRSGQEIQMEEIPVSPKSRIEGVTLAESNIRKDLNLIIIAVKKPDGTMRFNPSFDTRLYAGDTVIAVGGRENLEKLESVLNP